jgi:hypothetical protein
MIISGGHFRVAPFVTDLHLTQVPQPPAPMPVFSPLVFAGPPADRAVRDPVMQGDGLDITQLELYALIWSDRLNHCRRVHFR